MAANGAPPATLVQALGWAGLGELGTPLLLSAFLSSNPSIVTPLPQSTLEQISGFQAPPAVALQNPYSSYNKQGSAFAARTATIPIPTATQRPTLGVFKPLVAPKDSWLGLQNSFSSPDSRPRSPMVSLSTPTTPAEAMFRSLLQQNQQSEERQYPVWLESIHWFMIQWFDSITLKKDMKLSKTFRYNMLLYTNAKARYTNPDTKYNAQPK